MPFTFKLSVRLALMKASLALAAAAAFGACELPDRRGTGPTLPDPVVQVVSSPDTVTLDPYQTRQFVAFGRTQAGDSVAIAVRWSTSAGTITTGGLYTADTIAGIHQVTATTTTGTTTVSGSSQVKNPGPLAQVILTPGSASVVAGGTQQFAVYGRKKNGDSTSVSVVYSATGGSISPAGLYTAGSSAGTYRVIARQSSPGTLADTAAVTVTTTTVPVASVAVSPTTASVALGQTVQLTAMPNDANGNALSGRVVSWASSNTAVATVSSSGLAAGVAAGPATITATSEGQSGAAAVTVTVPPTNPGTVSDLAVAGVTGNSVTLAFTEVNDGTGLPASYDIRWAAGALAWGSATDVTLGTCAAPVVGSAIGTRRSCTVLGLQAGVAYQFQLVAFHGTLNVNAVFGALSNVVSGTTTSSAAPVASVTLSPSATSVAVAGTQQFTVTLKDASGNLLTGRAVTWASSDLAVATVTPTGIATAVAAGSATITATSEGQNGAATMIVTPPGSQRVDTVFAEDFESGNLNAWQDGVDATRHRVVTDPSFAQSGSHYLDVTYPAGADGGWLTRFFMPGYDSLYVSYYVRFPTTWLGSTKLIAFYGSRTDNQWSAFGQAGKCPNGTDFFAAMVVSDPVGPIGTRFYSYYPAMAREADGVTCWGRYGDGTESYVPPLGLSLGGWHHVEFWVQLNTPGQANARQTFWIDGVERGAWAGFSFRNSTILMLNSVQLTFSSGGAPVTEHLAVDRLIVTTGRPAP